MKAHLIDTHLLVLRSRSSTKVKVKYQGHVSQKMGVSGALVFHKHISVFFLFNSGQLLTFKTQIHKKVGRRQQGTKTLTLCGISSIAFGF